MDLLPTIWAGVLSVFMAVVSASLVALYILAPVKRGVRLALGIVAVITSLVTIASGVDSIVVHGERSVLVFIAVIIGVANILMLILKKRRHPQ